MADNWAHEHFRPKLEGYGHFRFCNHCWEDLSTVPSAGTIMQIADRGGVPSKHGHVGCVQNDIKAVHSEHIPEGISPGRKSDPGRAPNKVDKSLMRDWAVNLVYGALLPKRLIADQYVR
ncbi:unnamed protein product [Polarella glacialis]|uniref:Uncharacterized protein n=1 Tax=Polarella glacialis TaxID=89957 RepID=A0A813GUG8_POLGL|nr:unnamed protein product [Polarella glacialis]